MRISDWSSDVCSSDLEPTANGIGGDVYAMIWDPKTKKLAGLAGSGKSPRGLDLATVRSRAKGGTLPAYGAISVSVPGTRSEESRVGKECVSTCRSRGSPDP